MKLIPPFSFKAGISGILGTFSVSATERNVLSVFLFLDISATFLGCSLVHSGL